MMKSRRHGKGCKPRAIAYGSSLSYVRGIYALEVECGEVSRRPIFTSISDRYRLGSETAARATWQALEIDVEAWLKLDDHWQR
jgi:hypothetical protein